MYLSFFKQSGYFLIEVNIIIYYFYYNGDHYIRGLLNVEFMIKILGRPLHKITVLRRPIKWSP